MQKPKVTSAVITVLDIRGQHSRKRPKRDTTEGQEDTVEENDIVSGDARLYLGRDERFDHRRASVKISIAENADKLHLLVGSLLLNDPLKVLLENWRLGNETKSERKYVLYATELPATYYKSVAELGSYLVSKLKRAYPKSVLNFEYDQFTRQASFTSSTIPSDHACVAFATNNNYFNRVLGITENAQMKERQVTLTFIPNTSTKPQFLENPGAMFIYSDIVKYQMVSDTESM